MILLNYALPLLKDLKLNDFEMNSLSGLAIVLWIQQMVDCIAGIIAAQLRITE